MNMFEFKDFVPEVGKDRLFTPLVGPPLEEIMEEFNSWIRRHTNYQILNIETVTLPNIHRKQEEGSTDTSIKVNESSGNTFWHQFIRVWYRR